MSIRVIIMHKLEFRKWRFGDNLVQSTRGFVYSGLFDFKPSTTNLPLYQQIPNRFWRSPSTIQYIARNQWALLGWPRSLAFQKKTVPFPWTLACYPRFLRLVLLPPDHCLWSLPPKTIRLYKLLRGNKNKIYKPF